MGYEELERMTPEAREKYLEIIRGIPPGKKLRLAIEHNESVREFMKAGIRARNPGISDEDIRKEIIRRTLPPEIVKKVYGW
jgi:hypothetical protein